MKAPDKSEPAGYSPTDGAERRAVRAFESALDLDRVKPDIRVADKIPNTDGTLELTDEQGKPLGLFSVQVRSIGDKDIRYSCPVELLGYSERCSHPFLLVCVDVKNNVVFWKHIHSLMPEAKPEQGSFTIRFSDNDRIGADGLYLARWVDIAREYALRIADYPRLKDEVEKKLTVSGISKEDLKYFQRYISKVNNLLDNDFIAVKKLLLTDVWKLGVAVTGISDKAAAYQLFKVPLGSPAPLVYRADGQPFDISQHDESVFSWHWVVRSHMGEAEGAAQKLVLGHVEKAVRGRKFTIHGARLAADIVFAFLERHAHMIGLSEAPSYSAKDLQTGLLNKLPRYCSAFATKAASIAQGRTILIDFDHLSLLVRQGVIPESSNSKSPVSWALFSNNTNLRQVHEAIDYLVAEGAETVQNKLLPPSNRGPINWMWSRYTRKEQEENARYLLENTLPEYAAFVRGNRLRFDASPYLNSETTVVFLFSPSSGDGISNGPTMRELHVDNRSMELPKVIVQITDSPPDNLDLMCEKEIPIAGKSYKPNWWSITDASFLVHRTPLLNSVYRLLESDLRRHYGMGHIACEFP